LSPCQRSQNKYSSFGAVSAQGGLSLDIVPDLHAHVPGWMRPLFDSSLTLATVVAVILHQLLRWGALPAAKANKSSAAAVEKREPVAEG